ncbi:hypothetical protein [Streptomyces sp. bgisy034]|uniref:hypothetical protein n=1 Tax=Streptomyces sp. bgisy034 TaxID=3413774 RepID=UPI003EBCBC10
MRTTDPLVVFGVVLATSGAWLLLGLLLKYLLDEHSTTAEPEPSTSSAAPAPALHARPAALDETAPLTTVQSNRARHRKG